MATQGKRQKAPHNGPSDSQQKLRTDRTFLRRQIKRDRKAAFWKSLKLPKLKNAMRKARRAAARACKVTVLP